MTGVAFAAATICNPLTIWGFIGEEGMNVLQHCDVLLGYPARIKKDNKRGAGALRYRGLCQMAKEKEGREL